MADDRGTAFDPTAADHRGPGGDGAGADRELARAVALASLPDMGPGRLGSISRAYGFDDGWDRVCRGDLLEEPAVRRALGPKATTVVAGWQRAARQVEPEALLVAHRSAGIAVHLRGDATYPELLATDVDPPAVLFTRGHLAALSGPRVAIVGTRRCTQGGRLTAREMGQELAEAGVRVVSGLALGIDGAAHEGALRSSRSLPVVGVVGTGLDRVYPARHRSLWEAVVDRGLLMSEVPIGARPFPWRFPARNRMIAAVSDVVVVVESHATGGALITVDEAIHRDRLVVAVPGSVRSPAAAGTNGLLHDGVGPVRDAADVLTALGFTGRSGAGAGGRRPTPTDEATTAAGLDPLLRQVLDHLGGTPVSVEDLAASTGLDLPVLALAVLSLEQLGLVARSGTWLERV